MKPTKLVLELAIRLYSLVERTPGSGIVLDIVLGRAEDFNYVSKTTPPVKPPTK